MSFLSAIFGSETSSSGTTAKSLVVDGASVAGGRKLSPRDQLDLLRKFGKFAQQEELSVTLVFDTEPLRKVGDGEEFEGAKVQYTDGSKNYAQDVVKIAQSQSAVVVSGGGEIEDLAKSRGLTILRGGTILKAIDGTSQRGGSRGRSRSNSNRSGNRSNNRRSNNGPRQDSRKNNPPPKEKKESGGGVEDLLDMVD